MFEYRIEIDRLRDEWLERSNEVRKSWLLTSDGLLRRDVDAFTSDRSVR